MAARFDLVTANYLDILQKLLLPLSNTDMEIDQ